jgi:hypothetical protein
LPLELPLDLPLLELEPDDLEPEPELGGGLYDGEDDLAGGL